MEVCVDCVESALNAVRGGAKRLELCSSLSEGGLTPSAGLLAVVKAQVRVPVFCMIRPRSGDFVYSDLELAIMVKDITSLLEHGADGLVFGCLTPDGEIDRDACLKLVNSSKNIKQGSPLTFHRAIDMTKDLQASAEIIQELGFSRILTSGGKKTAVDGRDVIRNLVQEMRAKNVIVMPGAGISEKNLEDLLKHTDAFEFHASARTKVNSSMRYKNQDCAMGEEVDEFSRLITSQARVEEMCKIFKDVKSATL